MHQTLE